MKKRSGYIFTNKTHSDMAIMSTILGVISTLSLAAVTYLTYLQSGDAPISYGLTGMLVMLFSLIGLVMAIITIIEKDAYKLFPSLGLCFNMIAILGIGIVIYAGVYI